MEPNFVKKTFPWLIDPMYETYKINTKTCDDLVNKILNKSNLQMLSDIAEFEEEDFDFE